MAEDEEDKSRYHPSPDDALEPPDDIYNPAVDEERLEEDNDPPAEPAHPRLTTPKLPPNHPATDANIDFQELYDEGLTSATDADAQLEDQDSNEDAWPLEPEEDEEDEDKDKDKDKDSKT